MNVECFVLFYSVFIILPVVMLIDVFIAVIVCRFCSRFVPSSFVDGRGCTCRCGCGCGGNGGDDGYHGYHGCDTCDS